MRRAQMLMLATVAVTLVLGANAPAQEAPAVTEMIDTTLFVSSETGERSFAKEARIAAPVEEVYAAWTTSAGWGRVYGPPSIARIDMAIGGRYEWLFDGVTGSNGCQVLSFIPGRLISFSWNAPPTQPESREKRTWVVVELEPDTDQQTRVRLTHLGFGEGPPWDETYAYFERAWDAVLRRMQEKLGRRSATVPYEHPLDRLEDLEVHARTAEVRRRDGAPALELDGLLLVPGLVRTDVGVEVDILVDGPAIRALPFTPQPGGISSWPMPCPRRATSPMPCSTTRCSAARTPGSCTTVPHTRGRHGYRRGSGSPSASTWSATGP